MKHLYLSFVLLMSLTFLPLALAEVRGTGGASSQVKNSTSEPKANDDVERAKKQYQECVSALDRERHFDFEAADPNNAYKISAQMLMGAARCAQGIGNGILDLFVSLPKGIFYLFKFQYYDTPEWVYEKTKTFIYNQWQKTDDPIVGAADAAKSNVKLYDQAMAATRLQWAALNEFALKTTELINKEFREFKCLPASLQSKILCRLITDVFLTIYTPDKILKGAKWTAKVGEKVQKFLQAIFKSSRYEDLDFAARLDKATYEISDAAQAARTAEIERAASNAAEGARVEERAKAAAEASRVAASREIRGTADVKWHGKDSRLIVQNIAGNDGLKKASFVNHVGTADEEWLNLEIDVHGLMQTNSQNGKIFLNKVIADGKSTLGFADLDELKWANGSALGHPGGNRYIQAMVDAFRSNLRDGDLLVRYGGDEFLVIFKNTDPLHAKQVMERVNIAMNEPGSPGKALFKDVVDYMRAKQNAVSSAKSVAELRATPEGLDVWDKMDEFERGLAEHAFEKFKQTKLPIMEKKITEALNNRPGVSVATKKIEAGKSLDEEILTLSKESNIYKLHKKRSQGIDASAYEK